MEALVINSSKSKYSLFVENASFLNFLNPFRSLVIDQNF